MKILVTFKPVPDIVASASGAAGDGVQWMINPFDEIAIEEALQIKERGQANEVVAVTVSSERAEDQIRAALAMGMDRAIRVDDPRNLDSYAVARILAALVGREKPDVIFMGKQAVDDDSNQVGQMLAGLLGWPQATFVSKVEIAPGLARCTRETDRGLEVIAVRFPAVLTVDLRLNEPRYVSLPGLMKARRRPVETMSLSDLGIDVSPRTTVLSVQAAPRRSAGVRVESVEDLMLRLREEEKLL